MAYWIYKEIMWKEFVIEDMSRDAAEVISKLKTAKKK